MASAPRTMDPGRTKDQERSTKDLSQRGIENRASGLARLKPRAPVRLEDPAGCHSVCAVPQSVREVDAQDAVRRWNFDPKAGADVDLKRHCSRVEGMRCVRDVGKERDAESRG